MRRTPSRSGWHLVLAVALTVASTDASRAGDAPPAEPVAAGTIVGQVRFQGEAPPTEPHHAHHDPSVCGEGGMVPDETLVVGGDGALANVVVVLQGVVDPEPARPAAGRPTLDQQACRFVPHVQSVDAGATLAITSSDPVLHNVHAFLGKRTAFNLAIPVAGKSIDRRLDEPGILRIRCDSGHDWMSAYVAVVAHRFHATTGADGRFVLPPVPPGDYTLRAWHERLGAVEQKVTVTAGAEAAISLTFKPADDPTAPPQVTTEATDARVGEALAATRTALQQLDDRRRHDERDRLAREGRPLFEKLCATCHGRAGDGRGPSARFTSTPPRDFTRGSYKFRTTPVGSPPTQDDLIRTISVGVRGTHMPAWRGTLRAADIATLARYLTTLSDAFWTDGPPVETLVIPAEPPYDAASVARGKALYGTMQCQTCHGPAGKADGPAAALLKDDWGHPIRPANFARGAYKGGCCGAAVYRAISTGLGGTPMPSFGAALSPAERWDLSHYVLSLGHRRPTVDYLFRDPIGRSTPP